MTDQGLIEAMLRQAAAIEKLAEAIAGKKSFSSGGDKPSNKPPAWLAGYEFDVSGCGEDIHAAALCQDIKSNREELGLDRWSSYRINQALNSLGLKRVKVKGTWQVRGLVESGDC